MEVLYDKELTVTTGAESVSVFRIRIGLTTGKIIDIQLTDERDPFFLFTTQFSENDYHNMKKEQNLNVDFYGFPAVLMEYLEATIPDVKQNSGKQKLECYFADGELSIKETVRIKQLVYVRLPLRAANDGAMKKYLAGLVQQYKATSEDLSKRLTYQIEQNKEGDNAFREARQQLEKLLRERESRIADLTTDLEATKQIRGQLEAQLRLLQDAASKVPRLEAELDALKTAKAQLELQYNDVNSRLAASQAASALRVSALEQQLADKQQLLQKSTEMKDGIADTLATVKEQNVRLEEKNSSLREEVKKANSIIQMLQTQLGACKRKISENKERLQAHEHLEAECQREVEMKTQLVESVQQQLKDKTMECERLQGEIEKQKRMLQEKEEEIQKNSTMINYLHQEVSQLKLQPSSSSSPHLSNLPSVSHSAYNFRPSFKSLHTVSYQPTTQLVR